MAKTLASSLREAIVGVVPLATILRHARELDDWLAEAPRKRQLRRLHSNQRLLRALHPT
jgi:hypothetical protein